MKSYEQKWLGLGAGLVIYSANPLLSSLLFIYIFIYLLGLMNWFELITVSAVLCRFDNTLWLACNALSGRKTRHSKAAERGVIFFYLFFFPPPRPRLSAVWSNLSGLSQLNADMGLVMAFMNMMSWTGMAALQPATCLRNPASSLCTFPF